MIDQGYECGHCGERHEGLPFSYGSGAPAYWREEFAADERSRLEDEICVIQGEHFFVRARLVIPVHDAGEDFEWGIWTTLSRPNFARMLEVWDTPGREAEPAYFGWLSTELPVYPESTINLKLMVHTAPLGERPHVLVEPTEHPLAVEQHRGITLARVRQIASLVQHAGA
ncbi:DUF2199 domain-containing protein [Catenuloplanes atrovinosus]|uniref:DUF2199 domain-containing protein n=1 Tax=Catenuloplanes atrovinosus TaxID=137266 RepID=A0AAE3YSN7_9ACTN|nr:DUF2199 domain-containing protein [Catenuloplanes atrovinosus]MDR7277892.1 hypothetical protein [Catenuloplanes atrovinosus]